MDIKWSIITFIFQSKAIRTICEYLYLQHCDQHHQRSYGVHDASIVGQQGVAAAFLPHVELLSVVVVTVVGRIVRHLVLNAGSWGAGVTAAERHSIHQILAVHITPNATRRQSVGLAKRRYNFYSIYKVRVQDCM